MASQIESDSCNLGNSVLPIGPNIDILQCGPALEVWGEGCCCPTLMGSGTVEGRVMTITLPRTINRDTSCSLAVVETDVASLSPDRFSGEATLAVSDPAGACGPGFPCQIRASFQASPCVGTECDIACLEIVCPLFLCHMISC